MQDDLGQGQIYPYKCEGGDDASGCCPHPVHGKERGLGKLFNSSRLHVPRNVPKNVSGEVNLRRRGDLCSPESLGIRDPL